ncbi:unnamed protein product [Albugo candida]|uniref:Uncharacterized protein n=1 Tax=Albugo candida TaxID=65357 RepID=A0A024GE96_9STRA|nr:unnamed protein product [Albugo candida]|eukprot:CCI45088.1 unnamed protein product [Albugo candida]
MYRWRLSVPSNDHDLWFTPRTFELRFAAFSNCGPIKAGFVSQTSAQSYCGNLSWMKIITITVEYSSATLESIPSDDRKRIRLEVFNQEFLQALGKKKKHLYETQD